MSDLHNSYPGSHDFDRGILPDIDLRGLPEASAIAITGLAAMAAIGGVCVAQKVLGKRYPKT